MGFSCGRFMFMFPPTPSPRGAVPESQFLLLPSCVQSRVARACKTPSAEYSGVCCVTVAGSRGPRVHDDPERGSSKRLLPTTEVVALRAQPEIIATGSR